MRKVVIIGGGLAGSEAAWQIAKRDINVSLYEMRPTVETGAHVTDDLGELVCSNSLGSNLPDRASGVLKTELRRLGSLLMECADHTAVPAGGALAVDRQAFSQLITKRIKEHPKIEVIQQEITEIPIGPTIIASGPLTSMNLANSIAAVSGETGADDESTWTHRFWANAIHRDLGNHAGVRPGVPALSRRSDRPAQSRGIEPGRGQGPGRPGRRHGHAHRRFLRWRSVAT